MARRRERRSRWRWRLESDRLSRWANWATIIALPIALAGAVIAVIAVDWGGSAAPAPAPASSRLQGVDLAVRNGLPPQKAGLEVLLHNAGTQRSVVSGAQIEILHVDPLPLCFTQGELPLSSRYGTQLSTGAKPGEVVEVPLHQQLGADGADRFAIALGLTDKEEGGNGELSGMYLFELDVSLMHDTERRPLHLSEALVSLPELPLGSGMYVWTPDTARFLATSYLHAEGLSAEEAWGQQMPCWRANTNTLRRALSSSAARSPQLEALGREIVTPTYAALEKWTPPTETR